MGPKGLVPSNLVFAVIPSLSVAIKSPPAQKEMMETLALARAKVKTITAVLKIS